MAEAVKNTDKLDISDGEYLIEVELSGGSGRASVKSPTELRVEDGVGTALIEWSSPNYDYMLYQGEKLLPVNTEGNSQFLLEITELDAEIPVIADTVAMSSPHEISYGLTFRGESLKASENLQNPGNGSALIAVAVGMILVGYSMNRHLARRKYRRGEY